MDVNIYKLKKYWLKIPAYMGGPIKKNLKKKLERSRNSIIIKY